MLTVGSLFAGIGGIDLGLERTGHFKTHWFCERDPYCQRVLAKHWPDVPVCEDVANIGADTPAVDVIAAGFPCQPVSHAGRRKAQDDDRWLWPHLERCISVLRPRGVLLENVPGLLTAGFDDVIGGLAACGYDAEWDCIPAAAVGAPHLRDRVFIIAAAMADAPQLQRHGGDDNPGECSQSQPVPESRDGGWPSPMANAAGIGRPGPGQPIHPSDSAAHPHGEAGQPEHGRKSQVWAAEPNVGRVADGVPKRVDRLRALGNAVVPQVAEYVGRQMLRMMGETNER
jgi:DNA (cytosine-5)-methyltransferase 1